MVSKKEFLAYEKVRKSGVTNMFAVNVVEKLSKLNRKTILNIMEQYETLEAKYLKGKDND